MRLFRIAYGSFLILVCVATIAGAQDPMRPNAVAPTLRYTSIQGDEEKFREDWWFGNDWAGGFDEFRFERRIRNDLSLTFDGRAIVPEEDYRLRLKIGKKERGYFLAEYSEFRKYFDGTGGFYAPFGIHPLELRKDMHLDVGNIRVEAALVRPGIPQIILSYEHQFRGGNKSLLEWGQVTLGGTAKNIFPSFKDVDEKTDMVGLDVKHALGKVHLRDNFHYERYRTDTKRFDEARNLTAENVETVTVKEHYTHGALYNAFRLESYLANKFHCSLGYLYSNLKGDAGLRLNTVPFGPEPFDDNWFTRAVQVEHQSHVFNVNGMLGPFKDFVIYGGMQAETADSKGDTDAVLTETLPGLGPVSPEALIVSNKDRDGLGETLGVRFTGLKYTTLYAEGKWAQNRIDLFEQELEDGALSFKRLTETDRTGQRYTLGLNTSPVARTTVSLHYRRTSAKNDYDNVVDTEPGYSAFIKYQYLVKDEFSARLTWLPLSWARVCLRYQLLSTKTDSAFETLPPSSDQSGKYDADIYSVRILVRPAARVHLTGLFSYQEAETTAFNNGAPSVVPYQGNVFSMLLTAGYSLDQRTNLALEYLFTQSNNVQQNAEDGLPLGVDNRRHGFRLVFSRQLADKTEARFQYGYYQYDDNTKGGADDYRAHVFALTLAYSF